MCNTSLSLSVIRKSNYIYAFIFFFFLRYLLPSEVVFSQTWRWNSCSFDDCYMSDMAFCIVIFSLRKFGLLWSHCWVVWETTLAMVVELDSQAWTSCSQWNVPGAVQILPVRTQINPPTLSFEGISLGSYSFFCCCVCRLLGLLLKSSSFRKRKTEYNLMMVPPSYQTTQNLSRCILHQNCSCVCLSYSMPLKKKNLNFINWKFCTVSKQIHRQFDPTAN